MRRSRLHALTSFVVVVALCALAPAGSRADTTTLAASGDAYVSVDQDGVRVGNGLLERFWPASGGSSIKDKRRFDSWVSTGEFGFTVPRNGATNNIVNWTVRDATATVLPSGAVEARLQMTGLLPFHIERVVRVLPGTAAMRTQTIVHAEAAPVALTGYTLEQLFRVGLSGASTATASNFNGGADWHKSLDYRTDTRGAPGVEANAEWLQTDDGSLGLLMERRDYLSSRMRWQSPGFASASVDLSYDGEYLGPIEPYVVPNPAPAPLRARTVRAGGALALEPAIVAFGEDLDDLHWQTHAMLMSDVRPYPRTINFNTDRIHTSGVDVGARDGTNFEQFQILQPIAKALGVETFVLDDGWQKYNGDWTPDPVRYPNGLGPVRDALEADGMRLGLWMAPGEFHPYSTAWQDHPEWTCLPVGAGTAAYNYADPYSSSNAAGIGVWDFNAPALDGTQRFRDQMRADIARLTSDLNPAQFKFDFLVWTDCQNGNVYEHHDAFFDEIDSLGAQFPGTGFGLDETNDFRGFPFESILRGPTWFQNGNPKPEQALHNAWTLAPQVPGFTIGQAVSLAPTDAAAAIDEKMAVALSYQMTFWTDIRELAGQTAVLDRAKMWTDFAKAHRSLNGFAYPLLSDPLGRASWSGMQPWDAAADAGYAMLYRLDAPDATQTVRFHAVRDATTYRVVDITPGRAAETLGEFSGHALREGIDVTIATTKGVRILSIDPV